MLWDEAAGNVSYRVERGEKAAVDAAFASGRLLPIELGGRDGTAAIASAVAGNL